MGSESKSSGVEVIERLEFPVSDSSSFSYSVESAGPAERRVRRHEDPPRVLHFRPTLTGISLR